MNPSFTDRNRYRVVRLVKSLPKELEGSLPTIVQVEAELGTFNQIATTEDDDAT